MRKKLAFVLFFFGFCTISVFLVRILSGSSAKQGVLKVVSAPEASVFLDNKHIGRTPFEGKIDAGEYAIKIVPESALGNFENWQGKITVNSDRLTYVKTDLSQTELSTATDVVWLDKISSRKSELSVLSDPDGTTVLVDNETKGTTPILLQDIEPGDHTLTLVSSGFITRNIKIKTTVGYKLVASVKLALSPSNVSREKEDESESSQSEEKIDGEVKKPYALVKETPTGFLRVREEPTTTASEAARVKPGEKYTIIDEKDDWYQIEYVEGKKGWISGKYAEKVK